MNSDEAKILHGLYFHRQMIGEELHYSAGEIRWLTLHSFGEGKEWQRPDGTLNSFESGPDHQLALIGATSADAQRPVTYLLAAGYITCKNSVGFRISVTAAGADLARELDSWLGRLNVLYKKHKDGVVWLTATVLVSLVTALVTKCSV